MIPRYTLPEMEQIWSDENKFRAWLEVEIARDGKLHAIRFERGDVAEELHVVGKGGLKTGTTVWSLRARMFCAE